MIEEDKNAVAGPEQPLKIDIDAYFPKKSLTQTSVDEPEDQEDDTPSDEANQEDEESTDELDTEDSTEDEATEEEEEDDEDEEDEPEQPEKDSSGRDLEVTQKHAQSLQSQLDRSLAQQQMLTQQLQQLTNQFVNNKQEVENTVPDIFSGRDEDDYPTIGELKKFKESVTKQIKVTPSTPQTVNSNPEEAWVRSQTDFNDVEKYVIQNMATLNIDPRVQVASTSLVAKYFAVRNIMQEEKLRQVKKKERQQKKIRKKKKRMGSVPNTGGTAKRMSQAKPAGKMDAVDKFFNQKWNTKR